MSLSADLREFVELLNSRGVEYVIVGAHGLAYHGHPRYTGDLDILLRPSAGNAKKMAALLRDFGFGETDIGEADFMMPDHVIQLGRVPNRIDLMTGISGVSLDDVFLTKIETQLDDLPVFILSKESLKKNKQAVGRPQDLADLEALGD